MLHKLDEAREVGQMWASKLEQVSLERDEAREEVQRLANELQLLQGSSRAFYNMFQRCIGQFWGVPQDG